MSKIAWPLAFAIALSALFLGASWSDVEERRARAIIGAACAQAGMEFSVEWNRPVCRRKP